MSEYGAGTLRDAADLESRLEAVGTRVADWARARRADGQFRARSRPSSPPPSSDAPRHIVCIVVDALRADLLDSTLTPFLDSLSPVAAVSPATWTFPAVTSLLTGQYPHVHGALRQSDTFENSVAGMTPLPPPLDASRPALPDRLAGAGYDTYGGFGMIVPFAALSGRFATHRLYRDAPAERLLADHEAWVRERRASRTFSYLHLNDLHEPVSPPAPYWRTHGVDPSIPGIRSWRYEDVCHASPTVERYRTHRRRLYRAAVEYVDNRLAAYRARLGSFLGADVLFVVTGDHGEGFWERAAFDAAHFADPRPAFCVGHGGAPYEAVTRVPLAIDGAPIRTDERVSLVDVAPTLLDAVGLPLSESADGTSLLRPVPADRHLLVEGARYGYEKKAVYADERKVIVSRGDGVSVALSLPDETPCELPEREAAALHRALPPWPPSRERGSTARVSRAVERRLDHLGYA